MASMCEADLERLYARLEKPLCNVVFRWVWNLDEAQDIVQDAFVRLWRMRERVDLDTVEPLIYTIALNLAASRRRSSKIWRWVSLDLFRDPPSANDLANGNFIYSVRPNSVNYRRPKTSPVLSDVVVENAQIVRRLEWISRVQTCLGLRKSHRT